LTVGQWWDASFGTFLSSGWKKGIHKNKRNRSKERKKNKEKIRKEDRFVEKRKQERRHKRQVTMTGVVVGIRMYWLRATLRGLSR